MKNKMVVIRQRPSIGDCLLLSPLCRRLKELHPNSSLTVITDSGYMGGALPLIFQGIPEIDRIECISSLEWTTPLNGLLDPGGPLPYTVAHADTVYDCNADFILFEREYKGDPPYGIAEFWLRHHNVYSPGMSLLPSYVVSTELRELAKAWVAEHNSEGKDVVGVVLRAGDSARDWNFNGLAHDLVVSLYTRGLCVITLDSIMALGSSYAQSLVGKSLDFVAAVIAECKLIITPDTGLLHMAQAVGVPQVALWGIMRPELRTADYNCCVVPEQSLGYCQSPNELNACECSWKFQRWSCMRRIRLPMILDGVDRCLARL